MDVVRLPLGILTGMGFIGAGAILHKENIVGSNRSRHPVVHNRNGVLLRRGPIGAWF